MKVWLIRLSMGVTLDGGVAARHSESALLPGRAQPRHRPAGRHAQRSAIAGETRAVRRGRLPDALAEGTSECAGAVESNVETDLGYGTVGLAQQLHRTLHPAALQVAVRRLAKGRPELATEVRRRDVSDTGERRHVKRLGKRTVHHVASSQHAAVAVLDGVRHLLKPMTPRGGWSRWR